MKQYFLIVLFVISLVGIASAQTYNCPMGGGYGGMMYGSYGYGAMTLGWIISVLLIVLIVAAIYWLVKNANRRK